MQGSALYSVKVKKYEIKMDCIECEHGTWYDYGMASSEMIAIVQ